MIDILRFIFQGPFTFLGVAILLIICFDGITNIVKAMRGKQKKQVAPADGEEEAR